jgi:hypothetical protein
MGDDATTKPTIETVLERINALGAEFTGRFTALESEFTSRFNALESGFAARFNALETEVKNLRTEVENGFYLIKRRIDVISIDINNMRADIRRLEEIVDKLEKQPA